MTKDDIAKDGDVIRVSLMAMDATQRDVARELGHTSARDAYIKRICDAWKGDTSGRK